MNKVVPSVCIESFLTTNEILVHKMTAQEIEKEYALIKDKKSAHSSSVRSLIVSRFQREHQREHR